LEEHKGTSASTISSGHLLDETRKMAPALFLSCHVIGRWNGAEAATRAVLGLAYQLRSGLSGSIKERSYLKANRVRVQQRSFAFLFVSAHSCSLPQQLLSFASALYQTFL
jgi:hypothetical protein